MNSKKAIQQHRKKIIELRRELRLLEKQRNQHISYLRLLNKKYCDRELDYRDYNRYWNSTITDLCYCEKYIQRFNYELQDHEVEFQTLRTTENNVQTTKAVALTLITTLLLVAGLSTFVAPPSAGITGFAAAQENTSTLAEIQAWHSMQLSPDLANGITFNLSSPGVPLGRKYFNTTDNYNKSNNTLLWLTLSSDSNVDVDTCLKADSNMSSDTTSYVIAAGNISWANSTENNLTAPSLSEASRYNLTYAEAMSGLEPGNRSYYRFWVDIPNDAQPGNYNNSLTFKTIETSAGYSC